MTRLFKWLAGVALGITLFCMIGFPLFELGYQNFYFLNHEINRRIIAKNPTWNRTGGFMNIGFPTVDVTDAFPKGSNFNVMRYILNEAGYRCDELQDGQHSFLCSRDANKFAFNCRKTLIIKVRENNLNAVASAEAYFQLTCL